MVTEEEASFPTVSGGAEDGTMYAIILDYTAPLDQIDEHLADHVAWLDQHYAQGTFLASGRREPRTGGVILARHADVRMWWEGRW